jgi:hypothetical protein
MPTSWTPSALGDVPITGGYNVRVPDIRPDVTTPGSVTDSLRKGANAALQLQGWVNGLWIYKITADFELAGTMVQGPLSRDFYPHHLVAPKLTFSGQTPNNYERNRLSQFVRQSHITAVRDGNDTGKESMRILVPASTWEQAINPKGGHKGPHSRVDLAGYIDTMQFGADRFVTAHDYTFNFTITKVYHWLGLESDTVSNATWSNFLNPPDINGLFRTQIVSYSYSTGSKPGSSKKNPKPIANSVSVAVEKAGKAITGAITNIF